jgi:ADP-heptose:LPS heptosyltransferase
LNILVIKTKFIGDTVLSSAFFEALKHIYPKSVITVVVSPLTEQVLRHNPFIDTFILSSALDSHTQQTKLQRFKQSWCLLHQLRQRKYRRVYILTRSFYSAWLMAFSGIQQRIGLSSDNRGFLLTHAFADLKGVHEYKKYINLLSSNKITNSNKNNSNNSTNNNSNNNNKNNNLNITNSIYSNRSFINSIENNLTNNFENDLAENCKPKYFILDREKSRAHDYLKSMFPLSDKSAMDAPLTGVVHTQMRPMLLFHLSGSNTLRRWRSDAWAWLAGRCIELGYTIIWSGVPADAQQLRDIQQAMPLDFQSNTGVLPMLRGGQMLPIRELAAIMSQCAATIAVDTGPMHLSAALGVPTIGLFGPGDTAQWQPVGRINTTISRDKHHNQDNTLNQAKSNSVDKVTDKTADKANDNIAASIGISLPQSHIAIVSEDVLPCRPCHGEQGCGLIQDDSHLPICMHNLKPTLVFDRFKQLMNIA